MTTPLTIPMGLGRQDAWTTLGTPLVEATSAQEALQQGGLANWNVRKIDLTASEITPSGVTTLEVPDRFASVFTNPVTGRTQYLGVVGSHYTPIQNESHVELLDALISEAGVTKFDVAGSFRDGKQVFITMRMPESLMIGGEDRVDLYLVALNSHDGSSTFKFIVTPVRMSCMNMLAAALNQAVASFSIRHTRSSGSRIAEARQALGLTFKYAEEFEAAAEKMIQQSLTEKSFAKVARRLTGMDATAPSKRAATASLANFEDLMSVWQNSTTMDKIKGTRWAGYQAVTEWTDHFMSVRDTHGGDLAYARASRAVTNPKMIKFKEDAFAAFSRTVLV